MYEFEEKFKMYADGEDQSSTSSEEHQETTPFVD